MNGEGGERNYRLKLFATRLLACSGSACAGEGAKRKADEINGECGGTEFRTGVGGRVHLCVFVVD